MQMDSLDIYKKIKSVLNDENPDKGEFYSSFALDLSNIANATLAGVYFLDFMSLTQKALYINGKVTNTNYSDYFDETFVKETLAAEPDFRIAKGREVFKRSLLGYENQNILIVKLAIKGSFFGFVALARQEEFEGDVVEKLTSLICAYSYVLKDKELGEVFKMQLKVLQESLIEKEVARKTIEKQHKKLLEMDQLKNNFLANTSHELRTPLNAIIGFSQALSCELFGPLNEKQAEYIKDIHISSLHLLNMINEILDISKIESKSMNLALASLKPAIVINEVIEILSPLSNNKKISVEYDNKFEHKIEADYQKFRQILYNLLSNAIKFTRENGKIVVRTYEKNDKFYLEVQDNGVGIDKKYHKKIFTKFVHFSNIYAKNESSTGLGLTITKELVKLHKGKITFTSELDKGTTFVVELGGIIKWQKY